ncbi:Uncharacterized protein Adt_02212 [Abeliophyllum distichum]|uniref:Uncharacterized protein n=1 Tax=Abeliophyllum distichum TaxID=126358 RepID=A0ABD1VV23_9LAMI
MSPVFYAGFVLMSCVAAAQLSSYASFLRKRRCGIEHSVDQIDYHSIRSCYSYVNGLFHSSRWSSYVKINFAGIKLNYSFTLRWNGFIGILFLGGCCGYHWPLSGVFLGSGYQIRDLPSLSIPQARSAIKA